MAKHLDDFLLITELQQRKESAFRYLVETYQSKVFNTVLSIVQDKQEAEDVSQEVFIEVYESVRSFRGEAKISTWVYRIATTKALENYRRRHTQKRFAFLTSLFGEKNEIVHHPTDFEHPGVKLENKEQAKILFREINKLPENQRVAFTLCNVEGLSYQEISEIMQASISSVESLIFRAKSNLRKYLGDYYKNNFQ